MLHTLYSKSTGLRCIKPDTLQHVESEDLEALEKFRQRCFPAADWYIAPVDQAMSDMAMNYAKDKFNEAV